MRDVAHLPPCQTRGDGPHQMCVTRTAASLGLEQLELQDQIVSVLARKNWIGIVLPGWCGTMTIDAGRYFLRRDAARRDHHAATNRITRRSTKRDRFEGTEIRGNFSPLDCIQSRGHRLHESAVPPPFRERLQCVHEIRRTLPREPRKRA